MIPKRRFMKWSTAMMFFTVVVYIGRTTIFFSRVRNSDKHANHEIVSRQELIRRYFTPPLSSFNTVKSEPRYDEFVKVDYPAFNWTDTEEIEITERRFFASEHDRVFILGVVAKNSTESARWDEYAIYGQWYDYESVDPTSLQCCFRYSNGRIEASTIADYHSGNYDPGMNNAKLLLWHITCKKPTISNGPTKSIDPKDVTIARNASCKSGFVSYLTPYYAMKKKDEHLVITTKFAYADIDPEVVVSFFETVRYLGVDKVITYIYHTLNPKIVRILKYYSYIGMLDYYTIELADAENVPHNFPPLDAQYMSDEWLVKRDAIERNIGSTYFGIFDMDEYLIPSKHRTYKALLRDLRKARPNASHFFFQNVHFLTDARLSDAGCIPRCDMFGRHLMTAQLRSNNIHAKMILMTSRVSTKTINNHQVTPLRGFTGETCPNTEAYLAHYGVCLRKFPVAHAYLYGNLCEERQGWVKDTSMLQWSENTVHNIIQITLKYLSFTDINTAAVQTVRP